jgi:molybdopterin molybdotransferase
MNDQPCATPAASCCDDHDPRSLSCEEALRRILAGVQPVAAIETLELRQALDRVLAVDFVSRIDVPSHVNSAMDGYALRGADLPPAGDTVLNLIGTALAGRPYAGNVGAGECVRIMTGAPLPAGTDTVVIQELVDRQGDSVRIDARTRPGDNVRAAGEDIAAGVTILHAGRRLTAADLGLIASQGVGRVAVYRRLRVAFFSTGDELKPIGEPLAPGDVHDSNRYTLFGMLSRLGCELTDLGIVADDREATRRAFERAAKGHDAVITSGGVSVGEADFVKETLDAIGTVNFWKIAIKPGRPLTFGRLGDAVFFGLPGNPVSVMVTFYQFVQPALRRMMGDTEITPLRLRAVCASTLKKRPGRVEFQRGVLETTADGQLAVRKTGMQGSGILTSMSQANCFIVLPMESTGAEPGALVDVQPFAGLI